MEATWFLLFTLPSKWVNLKETYIECGHRRHFRAFVHTIRFLAKHTQFNYGMELFSRRSLGLVSAQRVSCYVYNMLKNYAAHARQHSIDYWANPVVHLHDLVNPSCL